VAPFFDRQEILNGKAVVFRRASEGPFYWRFWVSAEKKRITQSLKTRDAGVAVQLATEKVLDAMSKERSGEQVICGTLGDAIHAYAARQQARLERGEIRGAEAVNARVRTLLKQGEATWGLQTPLSQMTQRRWDEHIEKREGLKLSTLKGELKLFQTVMARHGVKMGAPCVPDFSFVKVPPDQRSKRFECLNEEQFEELTKALIAFMGPEDDEKGLYKRSFCLNGHPRKGKAGRGGGRRIDQKLEQHRRRLLYRLVMTLAASGLRPHEAAGEADKSLRWQDVEDAGYSVETKQLSTQERPVVILKVRRNTKTGRRAVPAACGTHLQKMRELCVDKSRGAMVFQDLDGSPIDMGVMRAYFREVISRCDTIDFDCDFYTLRHLFITRRLSEGVPVATIALAAGNSVGVITQTYSHVMMSEESQVRMLYEQALKRAKT